MVLFGTFALPHVLTLRLAKERQQLERTIPQRRVAYRVDQATLGQRVELIGEIRESTISDAALKIEILRRLNDGVARTLDLQDGTTPTFNALLTDPEYSILTGRWFSGKYRVPYSLTFLEVA